MKRLRVIWILCFITAYANAIALTDDPEDDDDDDSIEDTGFPRQPFYDTQGDLDPGFSNKPTLSDDAVFLPHEAYCQYFYAFDGRHSYIYRCASGYRFDAQKLQCIKTKDVACGKRKKNINSSEEKNVGINFKCPKWSGLHPHNHYCHLYYSCESKKGSLFMCPPGKVFDERTSSCQVQNYVDCGRRENPYENDDFEDVEKPDEQSHVLYDCPDSVGVFAEAQYCNKFIRCWYGIGEIYVCPKGKLFDVDLKRCRPKNSVYCDNRIDPNFDDEEPTLIEDEPPVKCYYPNLKIAHSDCRRFYLCDGFFGRVYACPPEKFFDEERQTCRDASEVYCKNPPEIYDDEFDCPARDGIFRDEANCGSYYNCKKGKAQHIECPEGELFDTYWKSCIDAREVTCGDRLLPGDEEDEENVIDENPDYNCGVVRHGRFTHEEYCNWFYHCKDGKSSIRACRKGNYYDRSRHRCYDDVDCGFRIPKDDYDITSKPREFNCPSKSGKFVHPRDCRAYYVCDKNKHKLHHCPDGKLFHDTWLTCVDERLVDCNNRIPEEFEEDDKESRLIDPNPRFECQEDYGRYDHDEYCDWYYSCQNKKSSVRECKSGKYYDSNRRKCHPHKEVTCGHRRRPEDREISTTVKPTKEPKFECPDNNGKYPHWRDCSKFYECKKGAAKEHKCPKHKLFDARRQSCEDDNHVICNERIHPDMDPDEPEDKVVDPHPNYECKSNYGRFTHEEYCHWYYNCHDKKSSVRECRRGKHYDSDRRRCYEAKDVSCGKRKKPEDDGNEEKYRTTTVVPTFQCPKGEGKYPHERDCGKFYDCKQWKHKVHECPKHKLFDEKSRKCENEDKVKCENRIHPDDNPEEPEDKVVDPNPTFVCKENHGRYAHDNCDWYYHCRDRKSSIRACYKGKYYDRIHKKCKIAVEVDCDHRKKPEDKVTTEEEPVTTVQPVSTTTEEEETTTRSTTTETTPETSPTTETTTEKEPQTVVTVAPTTEKDDNPDRIVDPEPNFDCAGDERDFAHESYCHYYYSCRNNRVTLRECPEGKYFDIERESCEDWYLVSCGDRLTPEEIGSTFDDFQSTPYIERKSTSRPRQTTTQEPTTEKPKFVCPLSDGLFPDEKNCGKYYQCTNNVAEEKECPDGELFDIEKGVCNDEDDTNCGERKHPMDDPDNPDKVPDKVIDPEPDFDCTKRHGCFTHEVFCKWYYYCHDKRPEVRECSGDQYFDSARNKCLEWWMVFCDKRIIPEETTLMPTTATRTTSRITKDPTRGFTRSTSDSGTEIRSTTNKEDATKTTGSDHTATGDDTRTRSTKGWTRNPTDSGKETRSTTDRGDRTRSTGSDVRTGSPDVTGTGDDTRTRSTRGWTRNPTDSGKETRSTTDRGDRTRSTGSDVRTGSPDVTGTDSKESTTSVPTTLKPITDLCKEEDGDFRHPYHCKKYYTCKDGEYSINYCPDGTLFDQEMRICYREDLVDCHDRHRPEVTTQTPDDCDEWLRTRTTSADDSTTQPTKGTD